MRSAIVIVLLLAACPQSAFAQSGRLLGGAPAPPTVMPGPTVSPGYVPPSLVPAPNRPPVMVPGGPGNFSDKVQRCLEAGAAAGLGPNENSEFSRRCAN
jgi:hypothetical protein